jgi:hypothetical protein
MKTTHHCLACGKPISDGFFEFSTEVYRFPLCIRHLFLIEERGTTFQVLNLYFALKERDFPVVLEFFDGYKHIDIALPGQLYIEVNGPYHEMANQAMTDLSRSVYSLEKKVPTIIISNKILNSPRGFAHAVDELSKACRVMQNQSVVSDLAQSVTAVQLQ